MKRIVFIGSGGHGKVCAEIAELTGYEDISFLDDDKEIKACGKYKVTGKVADFWKSIDTSTFFFISIGKISTRRKIQREIEKAGGKIATLIHPNAITGNDIILGPGSVLMAGAVVNTGSIIGKGCIINTSSSVDHDCIIGDYCHIAVGAHLSGTVKVESDTWVGAGATVSNNINICKECVIGAGAVVVKDIKKPGIYIGVPARKKSKR